MQIYNNFDKWKVLNLTIKNSVKIIQPSDNRKDRHKIKLHWSDENECKKNTHSLFNAGCLIKEKNTT